MIVHLPPIATSVSLMRTCISKFVLLRITMKLCVGRESRNQHSKSTGLSDLGMCADQYLLKLTHLSGLSQLSTWGLPHCRMRAL